jgi:hypothetical protein
VRKMDGGEVKFDLCVYLNNTTNINIPFLSIIRANLFASSSALVRSIKSIVFPPIHRIIASNHGTGDTFSPPEVHLLLYSKRLFTLLGFEVSKSHSRAIMP